MSYRNTAQRRRILEVLQSTDTHPTASRVFDEVRQHIPSISLGTVYRNLNVLVSQGTIQKISCEDAEDRYDAITTPHIHFYCRNCGCVSDVQDDQAYRDLAKLVDDLDEDIETYSLICYGKCPRCGTQSTCN